MTMRLSEGNKREEAVYRGTRNEERGTRNKELGERKLRVQCGAVQCSCDRGGTECWKMADETQTGGDTAGTCRAQWDLGHGGSL